MLEGLGLRFADDGAARLRGTSNCEIWEDTGIIVREIRIRSVVLRVLTHPFRICLLVERSTVRESRLRNDRRIGRREVVVGGMRRIPIISHRCIGIEVFRMHCSVVGALHVLLNVPHLVAL